MTAAATPISKCVTKLRFPDPAALTSPEGNPTADQVALRAKPAEPGVAVRRRPQDLICLLTDLVSPAMHSCSTCGGDCFNVTMDRPLGF